MAQYSVAADDGPLSGESQAETEAAVIIQRVWRRHIVSLAVVYLSWLSFFIRYMFSSSQFHVKQTRFMIIFHHAMNVWQHCIYYLVH